MLIKSYIKEKAFKNNIICVEVKINKLPWELLNAHHVARFTYLNARRVFGNYRRIFFIYCSYEYTIKKGGEEIQDFKGTTTKYKNNNINEFIEDLESSLKPGDYDYFDLSRLVLQFFFILIPEGGKSSESRECESILNKKSVVKIINSDNNCFWYSMAICMNPDNNTIKRSDRPKTRIKIASDICKKCKMEWDKPVPFTPNISIVEHIYQCNIYIIDLYNIPVIGSVVDLLSSNSLMYMTENRGNEHYFLLYDSKEEHYHAITDIKKFLGLNSKCCEFCYNCMKSYTKKTNDDNHNCGCNVKKKKINYKNNSKILRDMPHFLKKTYTKGSQGEIEFLKKCSEDKIKKH